MQLLLHIGMHKTGTSALQALFRSNRTELLAQGVLYPEVGQHHDGAHHGLWKRLVSKDQTQEFIDIITSEAEAAPGKVERILISSELLEKVGSDAARRGHMIDFLDAFDSVVVIYFVRNQATVVESIFKQWVKDEEIRLSDGALHFLQTHTDSLKYSQFANWWASTHSHVTLKVALYEGGWDLLCSRFFDFGDIRLDQSQATRTYNKSMDGEQLKIKHWLNLNTLKRADGFALNEWLQRHFSNLPKTSLYRSAVDQKAFQDLFIEDNRLIEEKWGVHGLNECGGINPFFQTASPALVDRFRKKLAEDGSVFCQELLRELEQLPEVADRPLN